MHISKGGLDTFKKQSVVQCLDRKYTDIRFFSIAANYVKAYVFQTPRAVLPSGRMVASYKPKKTF